MKPHNRVVVTGVGIVSCLGVKLGNVFTNLLSGRTGIRALTGHEWKELPCQVAGVIPEDDFMVSGEFTKTEIREKSRPILLALAASRQALLNCKFEKQAQTNLQRYGVSVGMGMPDLQEIFHTGQAMSEKGLRAVSPFFIPRNLVNMAAGHISMETGFQGPNLSVSTACATGLHAIGDGYRLVQRGDADVMLCGGTESPICPLAVAGFSRMRALCTDSNDNPQHASRPFDRSRSGFVMSEGAAILVLEEREHAIARGADILAEVLGYGLSGDAHHISSPREDGNGAFRCMKAALDDADLNPEAVSYINAHATSTPLGDAAESRAIDRLFGANKNLVNVSSVKGSFGHLLGAAGSLEAAVTVLACQHSRIPPTVNLYHPDTPGRFHHVTTNQFEWTNERRVALTNSFGFGGTNASLCLTNHVS